MKKLLALTLALLMLCSFALAEDYTGTWYLSHSVQMRKAFDDGTKSKLVLKDDGTFEFEFEEKKSGTYTVANGEVELYDAKGKSFTSFIAAGDVLFYRGKDGMSYYVKMDPGEKIGAEGVDAFAGNWRAQGFVADDWGNGEYITGHGFHEVFLTITENEGAENEAILEIGVSETIVSTQDLTSNFYYVLPDLTRDEDGRGHLSVMCEGYSENELKIYLTENGMLCHRYAFKAANGDILEGTLYFDKKVVE